MPQSGKPPGPVRSNFSSSSSTYCWSFFQLSSRRANTFSMKASRSDWAFTARAAEGTDDARAAEGTDDARAAEGTDDADGKTSNATRPRQSRASNCLDLMADLGSRRLLRGGGFQWIPAVNDLAIRNSHDNFRGGQARWRR